MESKTKDTLPLPTIMAKPMRPIKKAKSARIVAPKVKLSQVKEVEGDGGSFPIRRLNKSTTRFKGP